MKKLAVLVVIATMIFFIGGGLSAFYGIFPVNNYALVAGIVGGIASTIGLLAFVSPRLTSSDIQNVEGEFIAKLANAAKSVDEYEKKSRQTKKPWKDLSEIVVI